MKIKISLIEKDTDETLVTFENPSFDPFRVGMIINMDALITPRDEYDCSDLEEAGWSKSAIEERWRRSNERAEKYRNKSILIVEDFNLLVVEEGCLSREYFFIIID